MSVIGTVALLAVSPHVMADDAPTTRPARADAPAKQPATQPSTQPAKKRVAFKTPDLSPLITRIVNDPGTDEIDRRRMFVFHGLWERLEKPLPAEAARIALLKHDLSSKSFDGLAAPALVRAEAAMLRGEPEKTVTILEKETSAQATLLRATALEQLGLIDESIKQLTPLRTRLQQDSIEDAPELAACSIALVTLARLEGRPSQDYRLAMNLLGKARGEIDRLYWPAMLAEARLLIEKDNAQEGVESITETLRMNPRCGEAWYLLGKLGADSYNFELASQCVEELREINRDHPLADLLQTRVFLTQKDAPAARGVLAPLLSRYPNHREALALAAAADAIAFDDAPLRASLDRFETLSPGNPYAKFIVGKYLSSARQYSAGEAMLRQVIAARPNWPEPRIELGLMLMQAGDEEHAYTELKEAVRLDAFQKRAANSLKLVEELRTYEQIKTEHFIIKYRKGVDEAMARDMPETLERIYKDVTGAFKHKPERPTHIEIMPDEQWFGVRITGMPWIWTIGACTGDVIALTPPKFGQKQRGTYDWPRVIRHEFTHTVTLSQTNNRIPHWFTEACAVSQEPGGRDYQTYTLLASALNNNKLFELDQINWGFIRPKSPTDRPLAYAQSAWMLEYITATYGHDAVIKMLDLFREGVGEEAGVSRVTGLSPAQFMANFRGWAATQVKRWGLAPQQKDARIDDFMKSEPRDAQVLAKLLKEFPSHTDLLRLDADRALKMDTPEQARESVLRYAAARPVDPWADRVLVQLALKTGRTQEAVAALEELDRKDESSGDWAAQLAKIHQSANRLPQAASAARRALDREPYNTAYRELAATIALQRGDNEIALHQLTAMSILEPDRAMHQTRRAALLSRMGRKDDAKAAAEAAIKLDPNAPVQAYLKGE